MPSLIATRYCNVAFFHSLVRLFLEGTKAWRQPQSLGPWSISARHHVARVQMVEGRSYRCGAATDKALLHWSSGGIPTKPTRSNLMLFQGAWQQVLPNPNHPSGHAGGTSWYDTSKRTGEVHAGFYTKAHKRCKATGIDLNSDDPVINDHEGDNKGQEANSSASLTATWPLATWSLHCISGLSGQ
ncbi:hypothetical protein PCANC_24074 [Puccinia coronata f. sp. avenae]|uniref:Uncharacterized protein n=1 Tax=Puccinia coronata f. sp. avenae TaxID=200324 RepID=A0A2N5SK15_9BASI|nr:hypothetical protein PCANC_24074 [Puccinia coronata f. sp. avenae]PLW32458.1 hypothetical protein PCASD_17962 [Puccinia coronata f. sp. avenae]